MIARLRARECEQVPATLTYLPCLLTFCFYSVETGRTETVQLPVQLHVETETGFDKSITPQSNYGAGIAAIHVQFTEQRGRKHFSNKP